MIRLFLADIDGCLSEPYRPFDLGGFARLRAWAKRAEADERWPRLGICSGRAYAYVEATAQALGLSGPALFESGGGRFDLQTATIEWNPALTLATEDALEQVRAFFLREIVASAPGISLDYGKRAQAGIVSGTPGECAPFLPAAREFVARLKTETGIALHAFTTPWSIDVVPAELTKAQALTWVAEQDGLTVSEVAFIGDSDGDIGAIEVAGLGFAPANAYDNVKEAADFVMAGELIAGVGEAYLACLEANGVDPVEAVVSAPGVFSSAS
ncbi:MAG: HAD hydrolase family protein [Bacteroidota bacterium]